MQRYLRPSTTRQHLARSVRYLSSNDYVQNTTIPTFHFQKSLPRLPVPKLDDTLRRYLDSVEPVVSPDQFKEAKAAVENFRTNQGPELQQALIARDDAHKHTSYINKWWGEMYLQDRRALPINYNPQIKLKEDPVAAKNAQNQRAASLIASSVRVFRTLRDGRLEPDLFSLKPDVSSSNAFKYFCKFLPESVSFYGAAALSSYPLDMSQYEHLFASTRIPREMEDELQKFDDTRHIVVQRGSRFYKLDVLNEDGSQVPDEQILAHVDSILQEPLQLSSKEEPGMGLMTTLKRDEWNAARQELLASGDANKESLKAIDSALFLVCLDHESPTTRPEYGRRFLVGDGANHWFDKSIQLIIAANGAASVNFEHSWGDGVAVVRFLNELFTDSISRPVLTSSSSAPSHELKWQLNDKSKKSLADAHETFAKWNDRLLFEAAETPVSKAIGKQYKIGTDGIMQLAIQLAHFRLHQNFVSTYESASTAAFRHGRTETVRSCTNEGVDFVKTMVDASASNADKEQALRTAVKKHSELTKNGVMGQGFDRHLFALQKMAELEGQPTPEIFKTPAHAVMSHIVISTSTLTSPALEGGSFGPVNEDCYGIGYGIAEEGSLFQVSSYRQDLPDLTNLLAQSVMDIEKVLANKN